MTRAASILRSAAVAAAASLVGWSVAGWWNGAEPAAAGAARSGPSKPNPVPGTRGSSLMASMAAVASAGDPAAQIAAAVDLASRLEPKDFAAFLENLRHLPAHAAQGLASRTVLRRWVAHDPAAALHWCVTRDPDSVAGVLDEWARRTPPDQLAAFLAQVPPGQRTEAIPSVFDALAAVDPEAAMELLSQPIPAESIHRLDRAFSQLAKRDRDWLLERAGSLPNHVQERARRAVAQSMAQSDAAGAFTWAAAQPDRTALLMSLAEGNNTHPGVVAAIASLPHEEQNGIYLPLYNWDPTQAPAIIDAIVAHRGQFGASMLGNLLNSAGVYMARADDPGALANRLLALGPEAGFDVTHFAEQWARRSPDAARGWAASLSDETQRRAALASIDPILNPPADASRPSPAEALTQAISDGTYHRLPRLVSLDEPARMEALDAGFRQVLQAVDPTRPFFPPAWRELTLRYPAEAAHWLDKNMDPGRFEAWSEPLTTTAAAWAAESPAAAAAWAAALPAGEARGWAAANVIAQWKRFDEPAARAFLESLPEAERSIASKGLAAMPGGR